MLPREQLRLAFNLEPSPPTHASYGLHEVESIIHPSRRIALPLPRMSIQGQILFLHTTSLTVETSGAAALYAL